MIVPLALVSTQRMKGIQNLIEEHGTTWYSNYSWRPGKLFDTVNRALTIFVTLPSSLKKVYSTSYQKWASESRDLLMEQISYAEIPCQRLQFWAPKLGSEVEKSILQKIFKINTILSYFIAKTEFRLYYRTTGGLYWKVFTDFAPAFNINGKAGHSTRETWLSLSKGEFINPAIAILSSNTFWWWYTITTNCRDLNPYDLQNFPVAKEALTSNELSKLGDTYINNIKLNSTMLARTQKQTGQTETQSFKILKSKPIIDDIDRLLTKYYGFTDEELDFIINYDIKYRMGRESEEE